MRIIIIIILFILVISIDHELSNIKGEAIQRGYAQYNDLLVWEWVEPLNTEKCMCGESPVLCPNVEVKDWGKYCRWILHYSKWEKRQ